MLEKRTTAQCDPGADEICPLSGSKETERRACLELGGDDWRGGRTDFKNAKNAYQV